MAKFWNLCVGIYVMHVCLAVGDTATKPHSHHHLTSQMCCYCPSLLKWHGCMCCPKIRPTHPPTFNSLNTKNSCILKPHMWCWHTPFHKGTTHTFPLSLGILPVLLICIPLGTQQLLLLHTTMVCVPHLACHTPFHTSTTPTFPLDFGRVPVLRLHMPLGTLQLLLLPTTLVCVPHTHPHTAMSSCHHVVCLTLCCC